MEAKSSTSVQLSLGAVWVIEVRADEAPVVTVTLPNGSTATPDVEAGSCADRYRALVTVAAVGRHVARAVASDGVADFAAWVAAVTPAAGLPDLAAVKDYLGDTSYTDEQIESALTAEAQAQRDACRIPAVYPESLAEALKRRVARNLAMRALPLAVLQGDAEAGDSTAVPGTDPEIRRLERRWPKVGAFG